MEGIILFIVSALGRQNQVRLFGLCTIQSIFPGSIQSFQETSFQEISSSCFC